MGRYSTGKVIINNLPTLKIGYLSKGGVFKRSKCSFSISVPLQDDYLKIKAETDTNERLITLRYNNKEQKIYLVSRPSNLGKGVNWFFVCPYSLTVCRNLVFANDKFMHRSNIANACYYIQTESKYWRLQTPLPKLEKIIDEPQQKYYKAFYNGKPTRRYKRYFKTLENLNRKAEQSKLIPHYSHKILDALKS